MIVSVIGMGYIGLPTAAVIASQGIKVVGIDNNKSVVNDLSIGKIHFEERELENLFKNLVVNGSLCFKSKPIKADIFLIAVPTPLMKNNKPDYSYIKSAVKSIAPFLAKDNLIILESTSPVGTTEKVTDWLAKERPDLSFPKFGKLENTSDIAVAYCPERVLPGNILQELIENDRTIGGMTKHCAEKARELYSTFVKGSLFITDSRTAELSKLVENSFRDVNIAFANELSIICDQLKINVWELIALSNKHPRVDVLQPGPGVGGHCIAVDPWFIVDSVPKEANLISTARHVNDSKPGFILKKIKQAVADLDIKISKLSVACLGLTFKANVDDLRESPAVMIAKELELMGFKNQYIVEPNLTTITNIFSSKTVQLVDLNRAINNAEIILLLVDHQEFIEIDHSILSNKTIIDTRGIWSAETL